MAGCRPISEGFPPPVGHRVAATVPDSTKIGINSSDPCKHSQNPLDDTTVFSLGRVGHIITPLSKAGRKVHLSFNLLARGMGSEESQMVSRAAAAASGSTGEKSGNNRY